MPCRQGKPSGGKAAQRFLRRYGWYVKTDVSGYFENLDHDVLRGWLHRHVKGTRVFDLVDVVLEHGSVRPGIGLPIGALTSQHFANGYLSPADRWLADHPSVGGFTRYMDDTVWWTSSKSTARATLDGFTERLRSQLRLHVKPGSLIQRTERGLPFLGFRVFPGRLGLSRRRQRRYSAARRLSSGSTRPVRYRPES